MFRFEINDIQVIANAVIEVEDNTLTEFIGENSNGKSVLMKFIEVLVNEDIKIQDVRRDLISDWADGGSIVIEHDNKQFAVLVKEELRDSCIIYTPNLKEEKKKIIRFFNEGGMSELLYEFGFRVYDKGSVCLQLAPAFGVVPFVTTSSRVNGEIVHDITKNRIAEEFINSYEKITFPTFRNRLKELNTRLESANNVVQSIKEYDSEAYNRLHIRMKNTYSVIANLDYIGIDKIMLPPIIKIWDLPNIYLSKIPLSSNVEGLKGLLNLSKQIGDYTEIINGVCPTCGKKLIEGEKYNDFD